jgi:DNA-binding MarR family transcriptional regulator
MVKIMRREDTLEERLYLGTAESEHIEMYLKAIWYIREKGEEVKVSTIAQLLNVTQPSVVQMFKKLNSLKAIESLDWPHCGQQVISKTKGACFTILLFQNS